MKILLPLLLILFFTSCGIDKESPPPLSSVNNSGELDTTFNSTGYVAYNGLAGGSLDDEIFAMTTDPQGRVIAVGASTNVGGDKDILVIRLTTSGTLDSSFSGNGSFTNDGAAGGSGDDIGYGVTTNSTGEIFVTGTSHNGANFDMVVLKITTSGALDSSFGTAGIFISDNAAGGAAFNDQGSDIAFDSTGKLLIAGYSDATVTNRDLAVWKLSANGVPDATFGVGGIFTANGSALGEDDIGEGLVIDSSDNIIVAGQADTLTSSGDIGIWKIDSSGSPVGGFNGTGFLKLNNLAGGNGLDFANDIVIDGEGKYYVTGSSRNADGNQDMVLVKINTDGSLDTTFNAIGYQVVDVSSLTGGATNDSGEAILVDSQGRIVVVGEGNRDMYIWRFDENGNLDENFNQDGIFSHDSAAGGFDIDGGTAVVEDVLNRVYIGGFSENQAGDLDAAFWRLK